jgi:hypothetical protein
VVEPGDALVSAGDAVFVVRGDGSGVEPFSPRPGSGANHFVQPTGVVVDAAEGRVLVADGIGALYVVDPADGSQTRVTTELGGPLEIGDLVSALEILDDGSLLAASAVLTTTIPIPAFDSFLYRVEPPSGGTADASVFATLLAGVGIRLMHGLAVREPAMGADQTLVSTLSASGSELGTVDATTLDYTPLVGVPVQAGAFIADAALDCPADVASLCVRYWIEGRSDGSTCIAADAAIFRDSVHFGKVDVHVGSPLRCPLAIEVGASGSIFVVDARADFRDPRVHRFDPGPAGGGYVPVLLAGESELPDLDLAVFPRLAVSTVTLPETPAAGEISLLGLACVAMRRRRAGRAPTRRGYAAQAPPKESSMPPSRVPVAIPILVAVLAWTPGPASAADPAPADAGVTSGPCRADVERLCSDVPAGGGGRARCLREHSDQVSPECRAQLEPAQRERNRERLSEARAECKDDVAKLCPNVQPGGGAILRCLRANSEKLSAGCREAMAPPAP